MIRLHILTLLIFSFYGPANAGDMCDRCPDQGSESFVTARLLEIDTLLGLICINVEQYVSTGDISCDTFEVEIDRGCLTHEALWREHSCFEMCGIICPGSPFGECFEGGYCEDCGFWSHAFLNYNFYYHTWGKGTLKIMFEGSVVLAVPFDFGNYGEYGSPSFDYIRFLNRDYSDIMNYDQFDALESVAIEVQATWPDQVAPAILIELKSGLIGEPVQYEAMLFESDDRTGIYQLLFPPGALIPLIGDPENLPFWGETITAVPVPNSCDAEPGQVHDELTVVNYRLTVEEVSFVGDHPLFKDTAITNPPIVVPIADPVWLRTPAKNEAAAYTKNSPYQMNILVKSSHVPFHDFQYKVKAVTVGNSYNTREYTRHIVFTNLDTVQGITPES